MDVLYLLSYNKSMQNYELRTYETEQGKQPFHEWLHALRDLRAKAKIDLRLARVSLGNFGDSKPLRDGVHELKIDVGPGYRIYYGRHGQQVVLLLCAGDKSSQTKDIDTAIDYWKDFKRRQAT